MAIRMRECSLFGGALRSSRLLSPKAITDPARSVLLDWAHGAERPLGLRILLRLILSLLPYRSLLELE